MGSFCTRFSMKIIYTKHALERMATWRHVSRKTVEDGLTRPEHVNPGRDNVLIATKTINHEKVKVVYIREGEVVVVITVMTR